MSTYFIHNNKNHSITCHPINNFNNINNNFSNINNNNNAASINTLNIETSSTSNSVNFNYVIPLSRWPLSVSNSNTQLNTNPSNNFNCLATKPEVVENEYVDVPKRHLSNSYLTNNFNRQQQQQQLQPDNNLQHQQTHNNHQQQQLLQINIQPQQQQHFHNNLENQQQLQINLQQQQQQQIQLHDDVQTQQKQQQQQSIFTHLLQPQSSHQFLPPRESVVTMQPHESLHNNILCEKCGQCICSNCKMESYENEQILPLLKCGKRGRRMVCDCEEVLNYSSCMCCIQAIFYHCFYEPDEENDPDFLFHEPLSCCEKPKCMERWCVVSLLLPFLPCLLCYCPLYLFFRTLNLCLHSSKEIGCRCRQDYQYKNQILSGEKPTSSSSSGGTREFSLESESSTP